MITATSAVCPTGNGMLKITKKVKMLTLWELGEPGWAGGAQPRASQAGSLGSPGALKEHSPGHSRLLLGGFNIENVGNRFKNVQR